jgi:hypothetical protein
MIPEKHEEDIEEHILSVPNSKRILIIQQDLPGIIS